MSQSINIKRMLESQDVVSPNQSSLPFVSWGAKVAISYNLTPDEHGKPTESPSPPSFLSQKKAFGYKLNMLCCNDFQLFLKLSILAPHFFWTRLTRFSVFN